MRSIRHILGLATAGILASAVSASAAVWGISGGTPHTLPDFGPTVNSFNPNAANLGNGINELAPTFQNVGLTQVVVGGQLNLLVDTLNLTFTFLGREAGAVNSVFDAGPVLPVLTTGSVLGSSVVTGPVAASAPLAFRFESSLGTSVVNGGAFNGAQIAFLLSPFNDNVVWAFFDDGGGNQVGNCITNDCDFDDMIVRIEATPIPLPAAGFLLLGALGGLGFVARRRKAAA